MLTFFYIFSPFNNVNMRENPHNASNNENIYNRPEKLVVLNENHIIN
jgi:hypothetical protein